MHFLAGEEQETAQVCSRYASLYPPLLQFSLPGLDVGDKRDVCRAVVCACSAFNAVRNVIVGQCFVFSFLDAVNEHQGHQSHGAAIDAPTATDT